ncbi:MAG: crossover junction endodeoxyribonuclease RuvC [Firmicutes bacterium]|nr:crossover junction endodeoxyribonuclease RuvC [Bacillota bacterium]
MRTMVAASLAILGIDPGLDETGYALLSSQEAANLAAGQNLRISTIPPGSPGSSPAGGSTKGHQPGLQPLSGHRGPPFWPRLFPVRILEAGIIKTKPEEALEVRLKTIYLGVLELLAEVQPEAVVVEDLYTDYRHPRTAILMGHARATILLAAAQKAIPVIQYSPSRIKKAVTGNGRASKEQVQRMVQSLLNLKELPTPDHVADALAAALCHLNQQLRG